MSASFNFTDLYQDPVPDSIYERQPRCWLSSRAAKGGKYRPLPSDYPGCARTAPYEPILVIPMEVRDLDPEWASCRGGIEGVYDPPCKYTKIKHIFKLTDDLSIVALRPVGSIVVPTRSDAQGSAPTAAPLPSHSSNQAPKTTQDPVQASKPTASQAQPAQEPAEDPSDARPTESVQPIQDPAADPPQEPTGQPPKETSTITTKNRNNAWPPPISDFDIPETTNALSILQSALASAQSMGGADPFQSDLSHHQSAIQQEESDDGGPGKASPIKDPTDSYNHATDGTPDPGEVAVVWTHKGEGFTAILTDGAAVVHSGGAVATIAAGDVKTFEGQSIHVPLHGSHVEVDGSVQDFSPIAKPTGAGSGSTPAAAELTTAATWTYESQIFTAILSDGLAVIHGGGGVATVTPGNVETFEGQAIGMPEEGSHIKVDGSTLSFSTIGITTGSKQASAAVTAVFTASDQVITAVMHDSTLVLSAGGSTTTIARGAEATIAGQKVAFPEYGGEVLNVNGERLTMQAVGSKAEISASSVWTQGGETFTAQLQGDHAVVLQGPSTTVRIDPGSTFTIADKIYSVPTSGGVLVHDGTSLTLGRGGSTGSAAIVATSRDESESISALDAGESVIVVLGDRTFTLADGAQTSVDSHVVSAGVTGGMIVIDETFTLAASSGAIAKSSTTGESSDDRGGETATARSTLDSAATSSALARSALILALLLFVVVVVL